MIFFGPFRGRHNRSSASISQCLQHPLLLHQHVLRLHPGIFSGVVFFPPACIFNILCPTCPPSLLCTYPDHLSVASPNRSAWAAPLMYPFLIPSTLFTLSHQFPPFPYIRADLFPVTHLHPLLCCLLLSMVDPIVFCLASTDFNSSFFQHIPPLLRVLLHQLAVDRNVVCEYHLPARPSVCKVCKESTSI